MMRTFEAIYYDGRSTEPHPATVHFDEQGALRLVGEGIDLTFERADLSIEPRLGDTIRSISLPDWQKIETGDNEAVDALAKLARRPSGQWLHRLEGSWPVVLASLLVGIVFLGAGVVWGVPFTARVVAERVPDELAHRVGDDALVVLDKGFFQPSELTGEERARVDGIFAGLAEAHPTLPLTLKFRSLGMPNAFALPNGTVIVTDELVELADEDGELAAVLAHEVGHVHHRHGLRMVLESSSVALVVSACLGDLSSIPTLLAAFPAILSQAAYSRGHEHEADLYALEAMERLGVEPHHFARIIEKLGEGEGDGLGAFQYLSSHPPTKARAALAGAAADGG